MFCRLMLGNAQRSNPVHNAGHELPELAVDKWEKAARCGLMIARHFPQKYAQ